MADVLIHRYQLNEDGKEFRSDLAVIGIGDYSDEGEPDVTVTVEGPGAGAIARSILGLLDGWDDIGEVVEQAANGRGGATPEMKGDDHHAG